MATILNELKYAENIVNNGFKNYVNFKDLLILAKYYRYLGLENNNEIYKKMIDLCKKHDKEFNEIIHADVVEKAVKKSAKTQLRIPLPVPITENELAAIRSLKNYRYEKVLYCMLVLAKFYKMSGKKSDEKSINYNIVIEPSTVFRLAHTSQKKDEYILNKIHVAGLLEHSLKYDSYYFNFADTQDTSPVSFYVEDVENLMDYFFPVCEFCGHKIQKNSNRQKMCDECWKIKNRERHY